MRKARLADLELAEDAGAAEREEQHDDSRYGAAPMRRTQLAGTVLMLRHGKEDRRVAGRVDNDKIDDERCNKGLDHVEVIRRRSVLRPPLTG